MFLLFTPVTKNRSQVHTIHINFLVQFYCSHSLSVLFGMTRWVNWCPVTIPTSSYTREQCTPLLRLESRSPPPRPGLDDADDFFFFWVPT